MNIAVTSLTKAARDERHRVIFAGICALILTVGLARFAYTPMLPIMRDQAGLSHLAGGWLATINYAGYMSGALLAASISDLGRKFVLYRIGLVIGVLSTAAMGLTDNVLLWAGLRFVAGLSSTAGLLMASGLVLNWLIRQGHRPELGLHFMGIGLGIVVSGIAVGSMVDWLSWDQQWLGLGPWASCSSCPRGAGCPRRSPSRLRQARRRQRWLPPRSAGCG
jgi:MFS family permease